MNLQVRFGRSILLAGALVLILASTAFMSGNSGVAGAQTPPPGPPATPGIGVGLGLFAAPPAFSSGKLALSVFNGGTVGQLDSALAALAANGAWAQDSNGVFRVYILNGGAVNDSFRAAFPNGFAGRVALTLVGR